MSTFLELCQDVARESGVISGVQPASVISQTGRLAKVVYWTQYSWNRIQNDRNAWLWMRKEFTGTITAGTSKYTAASFAITSHARWLKELDNVTLYNTATGVIDEGPIFPISWADWRRKYGRGLQTNNRPTEYAISPANEICFGSIPDDGFTVRGEYYKAPQVLAANSDIPEMPVRFHQLIVNAALVSLGEHDEALVTAGAAQKNYNEMMADLERDQLPTMGI